ncbi:MAG: CapA family protein [Actinomycetota bacterium]|nr:CapA family protein [Actinomycetota bacterium]
MREHPFLAGALLAAGALVLAGCTAGPDDGAAPGPTTGPTAQETTGPTAQETTEPTPRDRPRPRDPGTQEPRSLTLTVSGDVLMHTGVWESAEVFGTRTGRQSYDFRPMFESIKAVYESADLAICHLEGTLARPGGPFLSYPIFAGPPQVADGLEWAGIDACTTASNHSVDQGFEGLERTLDVLDAEGIEHAGTARTRREARTPTILEVEDIEVALLSYTYGTNGLPVDADKPWSVNLLDIRRILAEASRAREAGAEIVVVGVHDGLEYQVQPSESQLEVFDALTRSDDIDLVYGHHAHVVQPIDRVNGTWVAYGLGNFIAQQESSRPDTYRGLTARFTFTESADGDFTVRRPELIPTFITPWEPPTPMRLLDVRAELADPETDPALVGSLRAARRAVRDSAGQQVG